jgi:hypothetical protein
VAIQFDGPNKLIVLTSGTVTLSVRDLWSRWVDWLLSGDNSKFLPAMSLLGGDDIDPIAGTKIPAYVSLLNGWRVRPQAADHTLNVTAGILLVQGGGDPFTNPPFGVPRINYQQPVQAIGFSTGGGTGLTAEQIEQIAAAVWATLIEPGLSAKQTQRLLAAVAAGDLAEADGVATVKAAGGTKSRVIATVDGTNRDVTALDTSDG